MPAHRELEKLVCTIHQNNFKGALETHWAYLCYAGLWLEPLRADLDAYMDSVNEFVTGEVTLKLYKGSVTPVARSSPYALYDRSLASFGESGGEFSQHASPGFIELFTLQSRLAHRVRRAAGGEEEKIVSKARDRSGERLRVDRARRGRLRPLPLRPAAAGRGGGRGRCGRGRRDRRLRGHARRRRGLSAEPGEQLGAGRPERGPSRSAMRARRAASAPRPCGRRGRRPRARR